MQIIKNDWDNLKIHFIVSKKKKIVIFSFFSLVRSLKDFPRSVKNHVNFYFPLLLWRINPKNYQQRTSLINTDSGS